MYTKKKYLCF